MKRRLYPVVKHGARLTLIGGAFLPFYYAVAAVLSYGGNVSAGRALLLRLFSPGCLHFELHCIAALVLAVVLTLLLFLGERAVRQGRLARQLARATGSVPRLREGKRLTDGGDGIEAG
jgi:hypothetical protein